MSDLIPGTEVQTDMQQGVVMTRVAERLKGLLVEDPVEFPAGDLGDHPEHELSSQLGAWTEMAGWMEAEVARAENRKDVAEAQWERLRAKAYTAAVGAPTNRRNEAESDLTVGEAHVVFLVEKAVTRVLRASLSRYERYYFAVSREMTRRQKYMERAGRAGRAGEVDF